MCFRISFSLVAPRLIKPLIDNLESSPETSLSYALAIAFAPAVVTIANCHFDMTANRIGYRHSGGYTCQVFNKILRLSQESFVSYGQGKLLNIMQVDTSRVSRSFFFWYYLVSMPILLIGALIMLFQMLGWACFVPILVMLATYKFNQLLTTRLMTLGAGLNRCRDNRVKLFTEVLHALRLCKMLAWEQQVAEMIDVKRQEEMKLLNRFKSWQTVLGLLFGGSATAVVQLATFSVFVLFGGDLTAGIVFSSLAIFDMIQVPMTLIPITVQYLAQCYVSIIRIERLLSAKEIEDRPEGSFLRLSPPSPSGSRRLAPVRIEQSQFRWPRSKGLEEPDSDDDLLQPPPARRCCERCRPKAKAAAAPLLPQQVMTQLPQPHLTVKALQILHGQFVLIAGPVGAGKSTLLSATSAAITINSMYTVYTALYGYLHLNHDIYI